MGFAFYVLCVAVAIGSGLAVHYLRAAAVRRPPWPIAATHGLLGALALAIVLVVLRRGVPVSAAGTTGFGPAAAILLGAALASGLFIAFAACRGRRPAGLLVALHAGVAVTGFVVLWTLVSLS